MTRVRKVLLSIGLVALMIGGAVTIVPPLLWGDHVDYSHVASIKDAREYQDRALLEKAWALPVATLYPTDIDFQSNASLCGPASVVNVLRSLHRPGDQATILQGTGISTVTTGAHGVGRFTPTTVAPAVDPSSAGSFAASQSGVCILL
jgi:hypothetical protein